MTALERKIGSAAGISFFGVGVVCHNFEPQVSGVYNYVFNQSRHPVLKDGSSAPFFEEGRAHAEVTLVFDVELTADLPNEAKCHELATHISSTVSVMRLAGGSVMPNLNGRTTQANLVLMPDDAESKKKELRKISRKLLPGFALVSRDDLLETRLDEMRLNSSDASWLDAWLDLSRINFRASRDESKNEMTGEVIEKVKWTNDKRPGWLVPIPVGFVAISELYPPGEVDGARNQTLPFQFVESIYSIGQWISPHRLTDIKGIFWEPFYDQVTGVYRCINDYKTHSYSNSEII